MAAKQDLNKNTSNNLNCSLCTKFLKIHKHKPEGETELKCEECGDDDPVVALCVDCELCLCKVCHDYHSKKNKKHDVLSLSDLHLSTKESAIVQKVLYCPQHQKNELDYYCETCNQIICLYCTVKDHVGHKHELVDKMATEHRNMLMKIFTPVEEMSKSLTKAEADIVSTLEKIKEQASKINEEIDKCYLEQLQELNRHHKELKKQVDDAVSKKEKALNKQVEEMKSVEDEVAKMSKLSEDLEKSSDRKVLCTKKEYVEVEMEKVGRHYEAVNTQPVEYDTLEFVRAMNPVLKLGDVFISANPNTSEVVNLPSMVYSNQKVNFNVIAKDCKGLNCSKGGGEVFIELKSCRGDQVTGVEVRDNNDGSYMASFVTEQVGEAKLSVSINGQQLKGSPYSIVVGRNYPAIDKASKIVNSNSSMAAPEGIAFNKDGMWAVADWDKSCVYLFDDRDELVRTIGSNGSSDGKFSNPQGVAFDGHNHLYVSDCSNHRIQKFDMHGNYLMMFGSTGSGDGQLKEPYGVVVHNDKVYVADKDNKRISVFQTNGQFCYSFGSAQLSCPRDITVSTNNQLLVADHMHRNNCIRIFTLDGHYVGKFGSPGSGKGQLSYPFVTTDINGFILVANEGNHRVSIFDKDAYGTCIHCFGSRGSGDGQFSDPYGIAVSPNGNIYVSDRGNHRVQIFSKF